MKEDIEHGVIFLQGVRHKGRDTPFHGGPSQLVEQQSADSMVLEIVSHYEGHLSLGAVRCAIVPTHRKQLTIEFGHECQSVFIVDAREILELAVREIRMEREEPQIDRARGQVTMERRQSRGIVGSDGSDVNGDVPRAHNVIVESHRVVRGQ